VILEELPALAFGAVLVAARVGGAVMLLPGLGEPEVPPTVRLSLLVALVALLMPPLAPSLPAQPAAVPELARLVATESLIGVFLGFLARVAVLALAQAGQVAALMIGLSSPLQTDAVFGGQATATGRLFGLLAAVLVFNTGLYALPLGALAESYSVLPPGEGLPLAEGAEAVAGAVAASVGLALRLAAPLVLGAMLGQVALGLAARLAPNLQIYAVAGAGQILAGLLLLALVLPALLPVWAASVHEALLHLMETR
jgi:flagellar biosynthesis protein FliR